MIKRRPFTDEEKAEIEFAYKHNTVASAMPRLKALYMFSNGVDLQKISKATNLSPAYISSVACEYRKSGIDTIIGIGNSHTSTSKHVTNRLVFTIEEVNEITLAYEEATDPQIKSKLNALRLRAMGKEHEEIAKITGYGLTTIRRFVRGYKERGLQSISKRVAPGPLTAEQITELKSSYDSVSDERTKNRIKALLLHSEGKAFKDIAKEVGLTTEYLSLLKCRYQREGISAVLKKSHPTLMYKHKFTEEQKAEIEAARKMPMDSNSATRLEVLWRRLQGDKYGDIAAAAGYHPVYIPEILRKYQEKGLQAVLYPYRNRKKKNKN